jgi:hypothetical protein
MPTATPAPAAPPNTQQSAALVRRIRTSGSGSSAQRIVTDYPVFAQIASDVYRVTNASWTSGLVAAVASPVSLYKLWWTGSATSPIVSIYDEATPTGADADLVWVGTLNAYAAPIELSIPLSNGFTIKVASQPAAGAAVIATYWSA